MLIIEAIYVAYFIILFAAYKIALRVFKKKIVVMPLFLAGIFIPILDVLVPEFWFQYYCESEQKTINAGPVYNITGVYIEDDGGGCGSYCSPEIFIKGYKFVETRINKIKHSDPSLQVWSYTQNIDDAHGSLYRFSVSSIEYGNNKKECLAPKIFVKTDEKGKVIKGAEELSGRGQKHRPVIYLCIEPQKIKKTTSNYRYIRNRNIKKSTFLGDIEEMAVTFLFEKKKIFFKNFLFLNGKPYFPINQYFYQRSHYCLGHQERRDKTSSVIWDIFVPHSKEKQ